MGNAEIGLNEGRPAKNRCSVARLLLAVAIVSTLTHHQRKTSGLEAQRNAGSGKAKLLHQLQSVMR